MTRQQQRRKILQTLYEMQARDGLKALNCEELASKMGLSWDEIRLEVAYLEEKDYIVLKKRQIRTRIFCTVYLTAKGIDWLESDISKEKVTKTPSVLIPFKLQLNLRSDRTFEVRALETPLGEPHATSRLPYTVNELAAILKALRMPKYEASRFTQEQTHILVQLGLLNHSHFVPDLPKLIGQALYKVLMNGDIHTAFQMALNQARLADGSVSVQLRFDEDAVKLVLYPWELLYQRRALLSSRAVELTRYISYPEAVTALPVIPLLRLLYIASRPTNLSTLPAESEQLIIQQALQKLQEENVIKVDILVQPTYEALLDYLETHEVHILHFDGHGVFARKCIECESMNYPHSTHCAVCKQEILKIEPQGYLAFENTTRCVHWISSETLGTVLYNRSLSLAVLSACWSSSIGGETLFGGIAPALIQAGIPGIVSMQLPISVDGAIKFMQGFYRALARFESIPASVNAGRIRMMNSREWFIPTLYLRSRDNEGNLFTEK